MKFATKIKLFYAVNILLALAYLCISSITYDKFWIMFAGFQLLACVAMLVEGALKKKQCDD